MVVRTIAELYAALKEHEGLRGIRFSLYSMVQGGVTGRAENVRLCCHLWNMRGSIKAALRLVLALRQHPEQAAKLWAGGCTCMTKTPDPKFHKEDCVYAALRALDKEA